MNKRITSFLLSLVMCFGMLSSAVPVYAITVDNGVSVSRTEVSIGDEFTVILNVPGTAKQISDVSLKVSFDKNAFELTDYTAPNIVGMAKMQCSVSVANNNGFFSASYDSDTAEADVTFNGISLMATFKVKDNATLQSYTFTVVDCVVGSLDKMGLPDILVSEAETKTATLSVVAAPVDVTGVTIDETLSIKTGETNTPTFSVAPTDATNKTVSFKSSDTSVATVNEITGEVTGIKKGTATITITTADGNYSDTCIVTVACSHSSKTPVAEKTSDCKNQGWDAYMKCNDCEQLFAENGTTEIAEIPFRILSQQHTGGSATCTTKAVCIVCGESYGNFASHSYSDQIQKIETLKTPGNCRDEAVYYYSCANCGLVEGNANHTFEGAKVATNHVGGTTIVNKADANHKTQTNGYTGDTKCLGCGQIIEYGQTIPADSHTPATVWSTDGAYHWKECIVSGCGTMIDGTKKAHYSNKTANKATCQKAAVCDECGVTYGTVVSHNWETTYTKDATGHWYTCKTSGCTEKNGFAAHTPDHQGSATEDYAIKCTACQYEIEVQLAHTHVYDKEVAKDVYRASKATCDKAATYYKSCKCGAAHSSETFSYGEPAGHKWDDATCTTPKTCSVCHATEGIALGHSEGTEWKSDKTGHWHICTRTGCGAIIDSSKTAHIPDRTEPTKTDDVKCTECGYVIATLKSSSSSHHHDHGTEWLYNSDEHWHQCKCGATAFIDSHVDADKDGKCDTCGYCENVSTTITTSTAPTTGDNSMIWLWLVFMAASAVGVVMMRVKFRKLD